MSSRPSQIILLCEDELQDVFARHFLRKHGYKNHDLHVMDYPDGSGSGWKFVRDRYPASLRQYRNRAARVETILIIMMDADNRPVSRCVRELDKACEEQQVDKRQARENVVFVIPKWSIETWLKFLRDEPCDEDQQTKQGDKPAQARDCRPEAEALFQLCQQGLDPDSALPDSLKKSCDDYARIKDRL